MTVDLLLIFFLQAEDNLGWDNALVRKLEVEVGIQRERCCIFEQMGRDIFAIHGVLHVAAILVDS